MPSLKTIRWKHAPPTRRCECNAAARFLDRSAAAGPGQRWSKGYKQRITVIVEGDAVNGNNGRLPNRHVEVGLDLPGRGVCDRDRDLASVKKGRRRKVYV